MLKNRNWRGIKIILNKKVIQMKKTKKKRRRKKNNLVNFKTKQKDTYQKYSQVIEV